MEPVSIVVDRACEDRVAALKHRHRNQLQNMISLVGLFGRQLPPGAGQDQFADLRARFEALTFAPTDRSGDEETVGIDLADLAKRIAAALDPERRHTIALADAPWRLSGRLADGACQLLGEMMIAVYRQALAHSDAGAALISIAEDADGAVVIRTAADQSSSDAGNRPDLGWSIAEGLARNLGGFAYRLSKAPLVLEAKLPGALSRR